jgi:hypothetical protein
MPDILEASMDMVISPSTISVKLRSMIRDYIVAHVFFIPPYSTWFALFLYDMISDGLILTYEDIKNMKRNLVEFFENFMAPYDVLRSVRLLHYTRILELCHHGLQLARDEVSRRIQIMIMSDAHRMEQMLVIYLKGELADLNHRNRDITRKLKRTKMELASAIREWREWRRAYLDEAYARYETLR